MRISVITLAVFAMALCSCKKEKTLSEEELLTSRDWIGISVTRQNGPGEPINETLANAPDCLKDDIYVFRHDNLFLRLEGASRCTVTKPDVVSSASWNLSVDKKTFTLGTGTNSIMKLTADSLVYQVNGVAPEIRIIRYARKD